MARDETAFVENETAAESTKLRGGRISLPLDTDGRIDWDRAKPRNKEAFVAALENDEHALGVLGLEKRKETGPVELEITEDHIKSFLSGLSWVEGMLAPKIIALQTKGKVRIPPELAFRCYQFSDAQKDKLAPSGAVWANQTLPLWLKEWIARVGPGAEFFGGIALITIGQTQMVMQEWAKMQTPPGQPVNGHAIDTTPQTDGGEVQS